MSLLDEAMVDFVFMQKEREPDGQSGFITTWKEGARFKAAVSFDASIEARVAESQGVKSVYTITTGRNAMLDYHDVIKRVHDGKVFRVTSDGDDRFTPKSSALNMRQVSAEEWVIPV